MTSAYLGERMAATSLRTRRSSLSAAVISGFPSDAGRTSIGMAPFRSDAVTEWPASEICRSGACQIVQIDVRWQTRPNAPCDPVHDGNMIGDETVDVSSRHLWHPIPPVLDFWRNQPT